jgi:hypothetical protein
MITQKILTMNKMGRREVLAMVNRRTLAAGLPRNISCHTFRATVSRPCAE